MVYSSVHVKIQEHHEEDFFLYIAFSDENMYGSLEMLLEALELKKSS